MDAVFRAVAVYILLLVIFRIAGERTLAKTTTFDFVLLLLVGTSVNRALVGEDFSLTNGFLIVITLVSLDLLFSYAKRHRVVSRILEGVPLVVIQDGQALRDRMAMARVTEDEVLAAAHKQMGLERLDQIKYAILEPSGGFAIIPRQPSEKT
jgi:uncharacterized membrane protein YcaP (DUF421 family)